jgi:hypothetical protein
MAKKKDSAAAQLGRRGGKKRWKGMTAAEKSEAMREIAVRPRPGRKKGDAEASPKS